MGFVFCLDYHYTTNLLNSPQYLFYFFSIQLQNQQHDGLGFASHSGGREQPFGQVGMTLAGPEIETFIRICLLPLDCKNNSGDKHDFQLCRSVPAKHP
jgi:hypothetical protein